MSKEIRKRYPIIAAILSLIVMGLGQLYNGRHHRALVFFSIEALTIIAVLNSSAILFSLGGGVYLSYFGAIVLLSIRVANVIEAFLTARKIGEMELHIYNRWYIYSSVLVIAIASNIVFEHPIGTYSMPSGSMIPTLIIGDHFYVDRSAYSERTPEGGDVVVFGHPKDITVEYISRIVGLPGDKIKMRRGRLHVNGTPVERRRVEDYKYFYPSGNAVTFAQYIETLPNGKEHKIIEIFDHGPADNTGIYTVPENHVFVMGDNRDDSRDSRDLVYIGYVPIENLVGRAEVLYFSSDTSGGWWESIRLNRIGNRID